MDYYTFFYSNQQTLIRIISFKFGICNLQEQYYYHSKRDSMTITYLILLSLLIFMRQYYLQAIKSNVNKYLDSSYPGQENQQEQNSYYELNWIQAGKQLEVVEFERRCQELRQHMPNMISKYVFELEQQRADKRLREVNKILKYLKQLGEENQKIKGQFEKVKKYIVEEAEWRNQRVRSLVGVDKIKTVHLDSMFGTLVELFRIKYILSSPEDIIQNTTSYVCSLIENHIENLIYEFQAIQISQIPLFKNSSTVLIKLFAQAEKAKFVFLSRHIDLSDKKSYFISILQTKFNQLYQSIEKYLQQGRFIVCKSSLQILKQYKISHINRFMNNHLKEKFNKFHMQCGQLIEDLPEKAKRLFDQKKYIQLRFFVKDVKDVQEQSDHLKTIDEICSSILNKYNDIIEDLTRLKMMEEVELTQLSANLGQFFGYIKLQDTISLRVLYYNKRMQIKTMFSECIKEYEGRIIKNINQQKFANIKTEIEYFTAFASLHLLVELPSQQFIQSLTQHLNHKIQQLLIINHLQLSDYVDRLQKLQIIDKQYDSHYRIELRNKYTSYFKQQCHVLLNNIKKSNKQYQVTKWYLKLKQLRQTITQLVKQQAQNYEMMRIVQQVWQNVENYQKTVINKDLRYQAQYIESLRQHDLKKFTQTIKEVKQEFIQLATKIQSDFAKFKLDYVFEGIKALQKYHQIEKYLNNSKFGNPSQLRQKMKKKVKDDNKRLWIRLMVQIQSKDLSNLTDLKKFMSIQIMTKGQVSKSILNNFNNQIIYYLQDKFAQLPKSASLKAMQNRGLLLKEEESLIRAVKEYIESLSQVYKIPGFRQIARYLGTIKLPDQFQLQFINKMKKIPEDIQNHWDNFQYRQISNILAQLKSLKMSISNKAFEELCSKLKNLLNSFTSQVRKRLKQGNFENMNQDLNKLKEAENSLRSILGLRENEVWYKKIISQIISKIDKQIVEVGIRNIEVNLEKTLENLMQLGKWTDWIPNIMDQIEERVKLIIQQIKQKNQIGRFVVLLEQKVNKSTNSSVADSSVTFYNQIMYKYSKQLQIPRILPKIRMSIKDAIDKFNISSSTKQSKDRLLQAYKLYEQQFEQSKRNYISLSNQKYIKDNLKKIKIDITSLMSKISTTNNFSTNIPKALANIFVYWSLSKSGETFYKMNKKKSGNTTENYLLQPHPIQVLSILEFVGLDQNLGKSPQARFNLTSLKNHVMQIKTGQGKSVIIASMAILLALMGHKVDCVSYSTYLSSRDYSDFKQIFEELGVSNRIFYGTFNQIMENLINDKYNVRNLVQNLFMPDKYKIKQTKANSQSHDGSRILLVDEIDVFFSRDFYGNTYNPLTYLKNSQITEIVNIIWENRLLNNFDIKKKYQSSSAYQKLAKDYQDCFNYIELQFSYMITDCKNFNSKDYIVQDGRVGYKMLDSLTFSTRYRYQTMFTYIYESQEERANVDKAIAAHQIGISINCGQFSYAEMISNFGKIFGVTGTLQSLSSFEQKILEKYQITEKTLAPSVYGDSLRQQLPILIESDRSSYYQKIASVIDEELNNQRALLIFFENENQLLDFSKSEYVERFREKLKIVTEKTQNRNYHIKKATSSSTVTLFTAPFGRGTDFVIFDPIVQKEGTAVIQTFLSEEESEEYQIKGRTARQGKKGTYQMILNLQKLESKFKITKQMINKAKEDSSDSVGKLFQRSRTKYLDEINIQREKTVESSKKHHQQSMEMKQKMLKKQLSRNSEFFFRK